MKNFATVALFFALTSVAQGYQENIERNGDTVRASFSNGPSDRAPIAGNFFVHSRTLLDTTLTCDQFLAQVKVLISDWHLYPHINSYALTYCTVPQAGKTEIDFTYGVDAWSPEAPPIIQAFLKDHQGIQFAGQALDFYAVTAMDVKTVQSLGNLITGHLTMIHSAESWQSYSGTDQWYPDYVGKGKIIQQTDENVFLNYVGQKFGDAEKTAFQQALGSANFVTFSDFFTLHLESGQKVDFWLGFGSSRTCGTVPCFIH